VCLTRKFFAQETVVNVLVSCAFPEDAAPVRFSHFFQLLISPIATEAPVVFKSESLA